MNDTEIIHNEELHAYVDGQLDENRRAQIEAFLVTHPEQAEYVNQLLEQNRLLHIGFDAIIDEPVPPQLLQTLSQKPVKNNRTLMAIAASLFIGVLSGYFLRGELSPVPVRSQVQAQAFTDRAAIAHIVYASEILHPVEVNADQEVHLLQWLSKRLGHALRAPDLTKFGYQIMGGRLLPGEKGAAAQLMYQEKTGKRLTLYISVKDTEMKQTAFRIEDEDGVQVLYWVDNDLGFALVGDIDRIRLLDIARVAYEETS